MDKPLQTVDAILTFSKGIEAQHGGKRIFPDICTCTEIKGLFIIS